MSFTPTPTGEVQLTSRSSTRSRLYAGGTFWRSKEYGEQANQISIGVFEDGDEGIWVEQHHVLKPDEQIFGTGIDLVSCELEWNQELRIEEVNGSTSANLYGIRWQIAGGETLLSSTPVKLGVPCNVNGTVFVLKQAGEPIVLRPRTHRLTLVSTEAPDPVTAQSLKGWDIEVLRGALNESQSFWTRMPVRPSSDPSHGLNLAEDKQDTGTDAQFLSAFPSTFMRGGDGLPMYPVGLNTGPTKVLVHLNYAEKPDGSMGEFNQIFEWVGQSSAVGKWERFST